MEFEKFLKVLWKKKLFLLFIPLVSVIITFFLSRDLPTTYGSATRLAAGLTDNSDAILKGPNVESQVNQDFTNIIQTIYLKQVVNQVSYQLLLHDLTDLSPFRPKLQLNSQLQESEKQELIRIIKDKHQRFQPLSATVPTEKKIDDLVNSMGYNVSSLKDKLIAFRVNNSDFIVIQFESENPLLSAFVLNTLSQELIRYYGLTRSRNDQNVVSFFDSLVSVKRALFNEKVQALQNFKVANGILDVSEEVNSLLSQISVAEAQRSAAQTSFTSSKIALDQINNDYNLTSKQYKQLSLSELNEQISATRNRLNVANNLYIENGYKPAYKPKVDSLKAELLSLLERLDEKNSYNPSTSKQDLSDKKLTYETSVQVSQNNINQLTQKINALNGRLQALVPNQAAIKVLQDAIDAANQEVREASAKYEQAALQATQSTKLRQVEIAPPGTPAPSKKIIIVILSGIASFVFCVAVFFLIFLFDRKIKDAQSLSDATNLPVLGRVGVINTRDVKSMWVHTESVEAKQFKSEVRAIRFEIDHHLGNGKLIAVTSLQEGEEKSLFVMNLALAYTLINKRVLVIDGNFEDPRITENERPTIFLEDLINGPLGNSHVDLKEEPLVVIGNKSGDRSLFEISNQSHIRARIRAIADTFDIVLIETPSLSSENKAKEWISEADNVISMFKGNSALKSENKHQIKYLSNQQDKFLGWVYNETAADDKYINPNAQSPKTTAV